MTDRPKITAAEMRRRIGIRYGSTAGTVVVPEHLVFFEVAAREPSRGEYARWARQRRIDAVAVGMVHRSGYLIHGFEIKVTRADLRQELREPAKALTGSMYCDRWWLALSDISLLKSTDKIPDGWGILAVHGRGLRTHVEPAPIDRVESPVFRAALLHAGQRAPGYRYGMGYQAGLQRGDQQSQARYDAVYQRGRTEGRRNVLYELNQLAPQGATT